jgi:FkbM family methyltransferase
MNFSAVSLSDQTLLGRALRLPLKLIPPDAPMPVLQGALRGKRWIAGSGNHGCWLGSYEHHTQQTFASIIRPGHTVYDLGANVGFYSLLASTLVGPTGKVFSFEPVPRNLRYLRRHLALNRVTNCTIWEVAVGRTESTGQFNLGHNHVSGHLTGASDDNTFSVRIVALDQLFDSGHLPPPDVIKCDVEGGEYDALAGAVKILTMHRPSIVLATHGPEVHEQCCDLLTTHRYRMTQLEYYGADRQLLATPT